jgi:hypothetical protein
MRPTWRSSGLLLLVGAIASGMPGSPAAARVCRDITPDGRLIIGGPPVDEDGRPCATFEVAPMMRRDFAVPPPTVPSPHAPGGFTTGEIGRSTTGEIGPFTTFSNSPPRRR